MNNNLNSPQENILCTHPNFIKNYFMTSRLHHLSAWKVELSEYILTLMNSSQRNSSGVTTDNLTISQNKRNKKFIASTSKCPYRTIMHIDMDCFFASVGVRDRLDLQDKPVAVAHSINGVSLNYSTSEIASCNYHARSKGIKNGMYIGQAKSLEPNLIIIPYEFDKYNECSKSLYSCLIKYANYVQAVSCDEAYIDVTHYIQSKLHLSTYLNNHKIYDNKEIRNDIEYTEEEAENDDDEDDQMKVLSSNQNKDNIKQKYEELLITLASNIKKDIYDSTKGCNASIGISYNILLARLATMKAKPNGIYKLLEYDKIASDLYYLPISELPGIGHAISDKCNSMNWKTCGDLLTIHKDIIQQTVGFKTGEMLLEYAQGIDSRILENHERKSIGVDINWGIRFQIQSEIDEFMKQLCKEVYERLYSANYTSKHITLIMKKKLYHGEPGKFLGCGHCFDYNKSIIPTIPIDSYDKLYEQVNILYKDLMKSLQVTDIRGIGIHLKNLQKISIINHKRNYFLINNNNDSNINLNSIQSNILGSQTNQNGIKEFCKKNKNYDNVHNNDDNNSINSNTFMINIDDKNVNNNDNSNSSSDNNNNNSNSINNTNNNNDNDNSNDNNNDNANNKSILSNDLDYEVFQLLPTDIQNEIINNIKHGFSYKTNSVKAFNSSTICSNSVINNHTNSIKNTENNNVHMQNKKHTTTNKNTSIIMKNITKNNIKQKNGDLKSWLNAL